MTYQELVKKVQTALAKADATKVEGHIAIQVNVTGEAEGAFYMEIADSVLYVAPYDYNDRDALLTADGADVLAVAQGKITLEAAIAEGKVAHEGDYDKTLALGAIIPAKKTAAKKAEAPKPQAPIRMQTYTQTKDVVWLGRNYQVEVKRMPDDSLRMVKDETGQKFVDNRPGY